MSKEIVYCIPNAPEQNGDLWVKVHGDKVTVMNPAGPYWRNRVFTLSEFKAELKP